MVPVEHLMAFRTNDQAAMSQLTTFYKKVQVCIYTLFVSIT